SISIIDHHHYTTYYIFFFQAEDGIRDRNVTGVQTCALPIFYTGAPQNTRRRAIEDLKIAEAHEYMAKNNIDLNDIVIHAPYIVRSEERRVGKECRSRW